MILVDICVPVLNRSYDFELNEEEPIKMLTEDIIAIIRVKEHLTEEEKEVLYLVDPDKGKILNEQWNLREQGIKSGARLILI